MRVWQSSIIRMRSQGGKALTEVRKSRLSQPHQQIQLVSMALGFALAMYAESQPNEHWKTPINAAER